MQAFLFSPAKFTENIAFKTLRESRPSETYWKAAADVSTSDFLLSSVSYLHDISKNIFEPQSILALPSSKFMSIRPADNYIQEHLRISMSSGLK